MLIASLISFNESGEGIYLSNPSKYQDSNGFTVVRLPFRKPTKWNRFFRHYDGLRETIEAFQPEVIFSHNVSYGDTTVVAKYAKNHPSVKLFADNHADFVNSAKNWWSKHILHPLIWRYYAKQLEPYLTKCYGVTPMRCRFLKEMYNINPSLIEFLPMGVDDEAIPTNRAEVRAYIREELGLSENDILVMTGGKIEMRKNTHYLYEAMRQINNPHLHLVVCGTFTSAMSFLEEKMKDKKNIHLLGWCNADRVMDVMVASDFVCFPGTHSTLWEQAVGLGLPAIFKHWDEIDHVNVNGNCIFVKGDDVEELANAILRMMNFDNLKHYKTLAEQVASSFRYSDIAKKSIGLE